MQITQCDLCKSIGTPEKINRWIEFRWSEGMWADFWEAPNKKIVVCQLCFEQLSTAKLFVDKDYLKHDDFNITIDPPKLMKVDNNGDCLNCRNVTSKSRVLIDSKYCCPLCKRKLL